MYIFKHVVVCDDRLGEASDKMTNEHKDILKEISDSKKMECTEVGEKEKIVERMVSSMEKILDGDFNLKLQFFKSVPRCVETIYSLKKGQAIKSSNKLKDLVPQIADRYSNRKSPLPSKQGSHILADKPTLNVLKKLFPASSQSFVMDQSFDMAIEIDDSPSSKDHLSDPLSDPKDLKLSGVSSFGRINHILISKEKGQSMKIAGDDHIGFVDGNYCISKYEAGSSSRRG